MLTKLAYQLYNILPGTLIEILGESKFLKPLRNLILRDGDGNIRLVEKEINYRLDHQCLVKFTFIAPTRMMVKAEKKGIENYITKYIFENTRDMKNGVIIDVGANFGFLSLVWGASLPHHMVHSFEIHPYICQALRRSVEKNNLKNITVLNQAVSGDKSDVSFVLSGTTAKMTDEASLSTRPLMVQSKSLDMIYDTPDSEPVVAIKIDTDGNDYEILLGAKSLIHSQMPIIAIETNQDIRIISFLLECGYFVSNMAGDEISSLESFDPSDPRNCNVFARKK